ncbi:MAG: ParB N-terminal domain-containing protein [Pseudomonadota bacterium]
MDEQSDGRARASGPQVIASVDDLRDLTFIDDVAEVEIPVAVLKTLPFTNEERHDAARIRQLETSIRRRGYDNFDRVVARLGRRGRLSVVDGGHRLIAAQKVAREFWTNLLRPKVKTIQMIVFRTSNSAALDPDADPDDPALSVHHPMPDASDLRGRSRRG